MVYIPCLENTQGYARKKAVKKKEKERKKGKKEKQQPCLGRVCQFPWCKYFDSGQFYKIQELEILISCSRNY